MLVHWWDSCRDGLCCILLLCVHAAATLLCWDGYWYWDVDGDVYRHLHWHLHWEWDEAVHEVWHMDGHWHGSVQIDCAFLMYREGLVHHQLPFRLGAF